MIRGIALCLVLALAATSAGRLACVWECVEVEGEAHAATACHEAPASGPTLTAAESHCPLTPDGAALWTSKGSEPQRMRPTLALERHHGPLAWTPLALPVRPAGSRAGLPSPGAALQSHSVLRI